MTGAGGTVQKHECPRGCGWSTYSKRKLEEHEGWCPEIDGNYPNRQDDGNDVVDELLEGQDLALERDIRRQNDDEGGPSPSNGSGEVPETEASDPNRLETPWECPDDGCDFSTDWKPSIGRHKQAKEAEQSDDPADEAGKTGGVDDPGDGPYEVDASTSPEPPSSRDDLVDAILAGLPDNYADVDDPLGAYKIQRQLWREARALALELAEDVKELKAQDDDVDELVELVIPAPPAEEQRWPHPMALAVLWFSIMVGTWVLGLWMGGST